MFLCFFEKNKEDVTQTASANNDRDTNARSASASPSSNNTVPRNTGVVNNNISKNGGDNTNSQSGAEGIGLSEPSDQEIYRDSTEEHKRTVPLCFLCFMIELSNSSAWGDVINLAKETAKKLSENSER